MSHHPDQPPMSEGLPLLFTDAAIIDRLSALTDAELDALPFGVIGFDSLTVVRRYNTHESQASALSSDNVLGHPLFAVVAPCLNNFMVAQRFEDAAADGADGAALDAIINYVLTFRMRPVKVQLRLLAAPAMPLRYLLVKRL